MFSIGFPELLLLGVVAVLVVGPKQLLHLASTLGQWIGGAKRSLGDIRRQVEDELHIAEIQQEIQESTALKEIQEANMELGKIVSSEGEYADPSHWPGMPPDTPDD